LPLTGNLSIHPSILPSINFVMR